MQSSMKKLAVFVMIAALAIFMAVATASAGDRDDHQKGIHEEYAFTGSGACLIAPGGFNATFTATNPNISSMGPNTWEGIYRFYRDGTGEMDSLNRFVDTTLSAGLAHISWSFKYKVHGGKITISDIVSYVAKYLYGPQACSLLKDVSFTPDSYGGVVSPDGETLFVSFGVPMKLIPPFPGLEIVCNGVQQGFRCADKCPDLVIPSSPCP
jgi:hypothetical protein